MPKVSFTKEFVLEVVSDSGTALTDAIFTTVPRYTEENFNTLVPPFFQVYSEDENDDDKPEKFVFDITVKGVTAANVRNVYLAMAFNYEIDGNVEAKMISLAYLEISTPNGLGSANAYGTLELKQMRPIQDRYTEKLLYNVNPLEKVINESLTDMYTDYVTRDEYTVFENDLVTMPYGGANQIMLHLEMMIPERQEILYNPDTLTSLKPAWIQYIFTFIFLYLILIRYVLRFIFSNQIMETHMSNNLPKESEKRWFKKFEDLDKQ